jgi:hypothetical protein
MRVHQQLFTTIQLEAKISSKSDTRRNSTKSVIEVARVKISRIQ